MYLYFVDESKAQRGQDFTVVGGLILEETEVIPMLREFNMIKRKHNINPSLEISWSSMNRSETEKMSYNERESLRKNVLKLVAKSNGKLISGAVHIEGAQEKGFKEDYQIYCIGLMVASVRLQYYMQDIGREKKKPCYSIIVAHRYGSHKDAKEINAYCKKIAESGTPRFRVNLANILINLLFCPADIAPVLQISDFCMGGLGTFLNTGNREYCDIIDFKFRRSQENGRIRGYGIAFYPSKSGPDVEIQWDNI
ncbi:MAG: DUF3800 domain-containing protein [Candidatus Helarchaeota archaeon]|nr:DUF3800 domain-containing protein [Candidatus Helarchaeota archaeon]